MPFRHLALQSPCRSIPFRTMRFLCCSLPCSSAALPIVRCLAAADHLPAPRCHCLAIPRRFLASLRSGLASLCTLSFAVAGRCYALANPALLMAMPLLHGSALCPYFSDPCSAAAMQCLRCSVRRFALANPGQPLPSLFCWLLCHCDSPQVPASPSRLCAIPCHCLVTKA